MTKNPVFFKINEMELVRDFIRKNQGLFNQHCTEEYLTTKKYKDSVK